MTQRLTISNSGYRMDPNDNGSYVYYKSHVEIVDIIRKQLDDTQKLLDEERQYSRQLIQQIMERK